MIKIINSTKEIIDINEDFIFNMIELITNEHNYSINNILINFIDDKSIHELNINILNHDYPTDIITIDYTLINIIKAEIYISLDTISKNAIEYNVSFIQELKRVIYHGILHIVGYNDKSEIESKEMRKMEDYYLNLNVPRGTL